MKPTRRIGRLTLATLPQHVQVTERGCWEWKLARLKGRYGRKTQDGQKQYAHRLVYELAHGAIPETARVLHNCDNPCCVNPAHLAIGSQGDNVADCVRKGRQAKGERLPQTRLTAEQIPLIRRLASQGVSQMKLSRQFSVSRGAIRGVVSGANWKHIPNLNPKESK